jgi:hypothetical protein
MNIRDVLRTLRVDFREYGESSHVTEGWIGLKCPYCGRTGSNYGLGIALRTLRVTCWKCGSHNLVATLAEASGEPRGAVAALVGDSVPERRQDAPEGRYTPPEGVGPLLGAHKAYLRQRGLDPDEMVRLWNLGGIGPFAPLKWRLFIPIHREGEPVNWTTRAIGKTDHTGRYRSAKREQASVPRGELLFGEDYCRHAVVVAEGPFSVFRIGPGAVCTCGVGFSRQQVARIAKFSVRVICFDSDPAAQRRAGDLADDLSVFPGTTCVVRFSGPQPDTSPAEEIEELRERYLS